MSLSLPTLCISGWAQHHDGLNVLCNDSVHHFHFAPMQNITTALTALSSETTHYHRIIGWSLGGALAMYALEKKHITTNQLVLLAAPAQFVSCSDFQYGMDPLTFSLFHSNYSLDSARTAKKFAQLITHGDKHREHITPLLAPDHFSAQTTLWASWLDELKQLHHAHFTFKHFPPTLIFHGTEDTVVKHSQSEWLAQHIPQATLISLPECGHAPHLHDTSFLKHHIIQHAETYCI